MQIFDEQRGGTLQDVTWLRRALWRCLTDLRLRQELIYDLALAAAEIMTNAVRHAQPAPTLIGLKLDLVGTRVKLSIEDNGGSFIDFASHWMRAGKNSVLIEGAGGRGLSLVRETLQNVTYQSGALNQFIGYAELPPHQPLVLIVEDEDVQLEAFVQILKRECRILAASTLEEGMKILQSHKVDLILTDVHLGDGLGTRLLHSGGDFDDDLAPPVILISADLRPDLRREVLSHGAEFFIAKPVKAEVLRETVRLVLARFAQRQARLAQHFAKSVNGLLTPNLPEALGAYAIGAVSGTASVGGGDLILHESCAGFERIIIMDVMGHGIAAKAWAIAYAASLRVLMRLCGNEPAGKFLWHIADYLWTQPAFATILATMLVMDVLENGEVRLACAGHPAPLLLQQGKIVPVEIGGSIIGVFAPKPYPEVRLTLGHGDKILLFTDGLEPHLRHGDISPWLLQALTKSADGNLKTTLAAITRAAEQALGPQPADDWTCLVLANPA